MVARAGGLGLALMAGPLYLGPVLAGWAQAPAWVYLVIVALFFALQTLRGRIPAIGPSPVLAAGVLAAVQAAVVGAAWGGGALLALATGPLVLPLWLPPALSALGVAAGLLHHRPGSPDAGMDARKGRD